MDSRNRQDGFRDVMAQLVCPLLAIVVLCIGRNSAIAVSPCTFDVREYGAIGDGKTPDTAAINKAIETCAAAGGGQVRFLAGKYLSGTLHLKSGVTLFLEAGATLIGSTNLEHYQNFTPPAGTPEARWTRWHRALLLGDGLENVTIAGQGVIDGNKVFDARGEEKMRGPHTILLGMCRNVTIRDISITDSANYAIMLEFCQQVDVRNVKITGGWDGVHFRGWPGRPCRDVSIVGCQFFTGDDSIAGRYWENVLITDCIVNSSCNGVRLIGPAAHLTIHNCLFYGPGVHPHRTSNRHNMLSGIILQPGSWDATEGSLDDVLISDVTMKNVASPATIWLKPGNTGGRVTIARMTATGVYRAPCSVESWTDAPFTTAVFRDVNIEFEGGGASAPAREPVKAPGVDARPLPAWGFYARNVKNLSLDDFRASCAQGELRPALMCEAVKQLKLEGFKFSRAAGAPDPLVLNDVEHVQLRDTDIPTASPRITELKLAAADSTGRFIAGKAYSTSVTAENGEAEGLAQIELAVANGKLTRWVWLRPNEKKEVVLKGLTAPGPGTYEARAGNLSRQLVVEEP
jgi:hypothetical protein